MTPEELKRLGRLAGLLHADGFRNDAHLVRSLLAERERLRKALEDLLDEQSDVSHIAKRQQYFDAVDAARAALAGDGEGKG